MSALSPTLRQLCHSQDGSLEVRSGDDPGNLALGEANGLVLARGYVSPSQASCEQQLVPKAEVGLGR